MMAEIVEADRRVDPGSGDGSASYRCPQAPVDWQTLVSGKDQGFPIWPDVGLRMSSNIDRRVGGVARVGPAHMPTRPDLHFAPSGRRESNPHDQLGRLELYH